MDRRRLGLAIVCAAAVGLAILALRPRRSSSDMQPPAGSASGSPPAVSRDESGSTYDGGAIARTLRDRKVRDELRRRILAQWAEEQAAASEPRGEDARVGEPPAPMPTRADGQVDPDYIRDVIRGDMFPMARACYEELVARQPDAGGRVEMSFKIIADEQHGGVVDEVDIDAGSPDAIRDDRMNTCVRESLLTLAFRPPPRGGAVTIVYPILFSPSEEEGR